MRAEILATGTEVLRGDCINTNATLIARELRRLDWTVVRHTVVGDTLGDLSGAIRESLVRSELLVTTGGLGPTEDDLTRQAVSHALGLPLRSHPAARASIRAWLRRRRQGCFRDQATQSLVPDGARVLQNPVGSAPGFALEHARGHLLALPAVPAELEFLLPRALRSLGRPRTTGVRSGAREIPCSGLSEAEINRRLRGIFPSKNDSPGFGTRLGGGQVIVRVEGQASSKARLHRILAEQERRVRRGLRGGLLGQEGESLEEIVARAVRTRKWTVAVAESCTGGLVTHRLTQVPGASRWLLEAIVCYSDRSKSARLGLSPEFLRKHGPVSAPTTRALAKAVRKQCGSQVGLAVTGFAGTRNRLAGPVVSRRSERVGQVFVAVAVPAETIVRRLHFVGTRSWVKQRAAYAALELLGRVALRLPLPVSR